MIKKIILSAIVSYKKIISPLISNSFFGCRFYPACSDYAYQAINKKGALKGGFLAFKRILRCNPLSGGGVDEVN